MLPPATSTAPASATAVTRAIFLGTVAALLIVGALGVIGYRSTVSGAVARPSIRVLLMSGYAADVVTTDDLAHATLLSKPFSPAALVKAVRKILDEPLSPKPLPRG